MVVKYSGIMVQIREVELRNKPQALFACTAKATVPVLVLSDGRVIDESRDIMMWALAINDPDSWLLEQGSADFQLVTSLLQENDLVFKSHLDKYKYADRFPEHSEVFYRTQGEQFLQLLEARLTAHQFLMGATLSIADIGIFPFIRQFANVDSVWFYQSRYQHLQVWLDYFLQSVAFKSIMEKYQPWIEGSDPVKF